MHLNFLCGTSSGVWASNTAKHHAVAIASWTMQVWIWSMLAGTWCNAKQWKNPWTCTPFWTGCQSIHATACAWWHTSETGAALSSACHLNHSWNLSHVMRKGNAARSAQTVLNERNAAPTAKQTDAPDAGTRNAAHAVWQEHKQVTHIGCRHQSSSSSIPGGKAQNASPHPARTEGAMGETLGMG